MGSPTIAAMQRYVFSGSWIWMSLVMGCVVGFLVCGCRGRMYQAASLPPELTAPPPTNIDTIKLSGLTDQSVSAQVVQPGDVLDVTMVTDFTKLTTTTTPIRVGEDGSIVVPLVGSLQVGGFEVERVEQLVNAESIARGVFRSPCITVAMKQCRTHKVTVVGAVNNPGTRDLPRGSTSLMAALLAAGGLSKEAGTDVEIRHTDSRQIAKAASPWPSPRTADAGNPVAQAAFQQTASDGNGTTVTRVDLALVNAGVMPVPDLHDGDVIHVAKRILRPVYVMGLVKKPGEFPYPANQELRVLDALALAGGVSNPVSEEVLVIRQIPNAQEPVRIAVSIQAAKNGRDNLVLAPGDTVTVEQTPATMVLDVIQTFFRFTVGSSVSWF